MFPLLPTKITKPLSILIDQIETEIRSLGQGINPSVLDAVEQFMLPINSYYTNAMEGNPSRLKLAGHKSRCRFGISYMLNLNYPRNWRGSIYCRKTYGGHGTLKLKIFLKLLIRYYGKNANLIQLFCLKKLVTKKCWF